MAEIYSDILKVQIGRVKAAVISDSYFPVVGETIRIDASMRWAQSDEWQTDDGSTTAASAGTIVQQKDSKTVVITAAGELQQKFLARNYLTETAVDKMIYAMIPQELPYFDVTATEVVRVGGTGYINIIAENGYATSRSNTIVARIYRENASEPVKNIGFDTSRPGPTVWASSTFSFDSASDRGIYDVEVDVTDTLTGITLTKRINKLITVTPKLCPKPADTSVGYEVISTYAAYPEILELRLWRNVGNSGLHYAEAVLPRGEAGNARYDFIDISGLPAGTTLCLKLDNRVTEEYPFRLLLQGGVPSSAGNENGTPNFTFESPLVITHDKEDVWDWPWKSYGAVQLGNNCRNIVLDGYGYHNTGIRMHPSDNLVFVDSCIYFVTGTSDVELFGVDVDGAGFAGVSAKTDPNEGQPWYWRENGWEFKNLWIHHCNFRNTVGEGIYLGYYNDQELGSGATKYHAHLMRDIRVYRCSFYRNGFDSIQVNNAVGIELCYCDIRESGYRREPNQGSAFSCRMDGKVYNCIVRDNYNVVGVISPMSGKLEIFNCILTAARMESGVVITKWTSDDNPETEITDLAFEIYNNVIKAANIASLAGNVSFANFTMNDNVFITERETTKLPGYFVGSGNVFLVADQDYENIDTSLKVADSANYNYQPAYNSMLVDAGRTGKSTFDYRGYKNWYDGIFHAGPFMGKYKDSGLAPVILVLDSIALEKSASSMFAVSVAFSFRGYAGSYRIGESADLSDAVWQDYSDDITYTFAAAGNKTLYGQLRDQAGHVSDIRSASIVIAQINRKAVVSIGWSMNNNLFEDGINKIDYGKISAEYKIFDIFGAVFGSIKKVDTGGANYTQEYYKGAVTGDDSGLFPDAILEKNIIVRTNQASPSGREFHVTVPAGQYKIRILCNTIDAGYSNARASYQVIIGETVHKFPISDAYTATNNMSDYLELSLDIPEGGFNIQWGTATAGGWITIPLNVLEVEEV